MSATRITIAASAVLTAALLAGGCEYLSESGAGSGGGSDIAQVCRKYEKALQEGDWPTAKALLTPSHLQNWAQICQAARLDSRLVKSRSTTYDHPAVQQDTATIRATGTTVYGRPTEASLGRTRLVVVQEIALRKIEGAWKIHSIRQLDIR